MKHQRRPQSLSAQNYRKQSRRSPCKKARGSRIPAKRSWGIGRGLAWAWAILTSGDPHPPACEERGVTLRGQRCRIQALSCCALLAAAAICARLHAVQGLQSKTWSDLGARQFLTKVEVQGARGTIYDRFGRTLGTSVETLSVALHPNQIKDRQKTAQALAAVLKQPSEQIGRLLEQEKTFVWLARGLPAAKRDEFARLRLNGISFYPEFERYYPQGQLAGSLLGTVGREGAGLSGIELALNAQMSAKNIELSMRRDARGTLITAETWQDGAGFDGNFSKLFKRAEFKPGAALDFAANSSRREGSDFYLTIDSVLQSILEQELEQGVNDNKARRAFGIFMDAETGEILSLAQAPGFNPNTKDGLKPELLRNFLIQDSFEPGSTMKPLIAAAALDRRKVGAEEVMNCEVSGRFRVGRHTIKDVHPVGIAPLRDVLVRSSNICMAKIGARMGAKVMHETLTGLGFGAKTGIELPGEENGILRGLKGWKEIDTATASFGQGVAVTGLQLVTAYAALANGGTLPVPHIIRTEEFPAARRVYKREVADKIADFLAGVTEDESGTARRARISGVRVAGKTGTAQKPVIGGRGYRQDAVLSSFIGFVNGSALGINRRIVALIVVDEPGVYPRWGGVVAAPIFRRAMERVLSHLIALHEKSIVEPGTEDGLQNAKLAQKQRLTQARKLG